MLTALSAPLSSPGDFLNAAFLEAKPVRSQVTLPPPPERLEAASRRVLESQLSGYFQGWVARYDQVGRRASYLWKWCRRAVEITTLPCVPASMRQDLCDVKALGVMWDVLLDDLADQGGNPQLLEELLSLPQGRTNRDFSRFSADEQRYAAFACEVWDEVIDQVSCYPCYADYQELLRFDYLQLCNVMRYSHLLNGSPSLLNLTEHDLYTPHNMHIMICSTIDLAASPSFDSHELGWMRQIVWHAQCMGRIGNLVTTWERELGENDFTSGVYARALAQGNLTLQDLLDPRPEHIRSAIVDSRAEQSYLQSWARLHATILDLQPRVRSLDVREYLAGFEELICLHLASRGRK